MRMEGKKQWEANIQLNVKLPEKVLRNHAAINWLSLGTVLHQGQLRGFGCCFLFMFFFFLSLLSIVQITMSRYFTSDLKAYDLFYIKKTIDFPPENIG